MFYVYVLQSQKDRKLYTGYSSDLKRRITEHNQGLVSSTKNRRPLKLIYYQAFVSEIDARREEKHLKSGSKARNELKLRITESLTR
ncbi:MAG: GIY-YIG catalytic domain protein [Microgenomates group bacterium GW2011_GWA2_40_6]|jgi:putative endonuclease|nr:MAG: GIY-YIG catalytic domain protein [Microgenomates group bacterium GW2011_GWA2_40_6]